MVTCYYNETDAAPLLGHGPHTFSRCRWDQKGPGCRKLSGALRYSLTDLHAFADAKKVAS